MCCSSCVTDVCLWRRLSVDKDGIGIRILVTFCSLYPLHVLPYLVPIRGRVCPSTFGAILLMLLMMMMMMTTTTRRWKHFCSVRRIEIRESIKRSRCAVLSRTDKCYNSSVYLSIQEERDNHRHRHQRDAIDGKRVEQKANKSCERANWD